MCCILLLKSSAIFRYVSVWLLLLTDGTSFDITHRRNIGIGHTKVVLDGCLPLQRSASPMYATPTNENPNDIIPNNVKLLILPGFGNVMEDYILSSNPNDPYDTSTTCRTGSLLQSLIDRGWKYQENVFILPILKRYEWIKVFLYGLFDVQFLFYSNAPPTNPAFVWYLQKIHSMLQEQILRSNPNAIHYENETAMAATTNTTEIILIGHSAGGWLGRAAIAYLLQQQQYTNTADPNYVIRGLVTLGSPHLPPPITAMDMTRGALRYTDTHYPGAYQHYSNRSSSIVSSIRRNTQTEHAQKDHDIATINTTKNNTIFYITVCGNSVRGQKSEGRNLYPSATPTTATSSTSITRFAYNSYEAVCGDGTTIGDGVVPLCSAHLHNAIQITLPNIYHSINVPEQWYGTDTVSAFVIWYNCMMEQIRTRCSVQ
jgi:PGAP1-like protein